MAQFALHGTWRSVIAMATLFTFIGMLVYSIAGGLDHVKTSGRVTFGLLLYVVCILVIGFGFWSKEDVIAITGITLFALLIILDILLRVGILSYNGLRVI